MNMLSGFYVAKSDEIEKKVANNTFKHGGLVVTSDTDELVYVTKNSEIISLTPNGLLESHDGVLDVPAGTTIDGLVEILNAKLEDQGYTEEMTVDDFMAMWNGGSN